jgi:uncharacterized protein
MPSLTKQKIVLDTNVWISALLWGGKPAEIIKAAENNSVTIFASEQIIEEISQVLTYPKLKKVYDAEGLRSQDLIDSVLKVAKFVKVTEKIHVISEHPADNKFVECASAALAAYIVSGDKHLLHVACYKKIQMLSVNDFLKVIEIKDS